MTLITQHCLIVHLSMKYVLHARRVYTQIKVVCFLLFFQLASTFPIHSPKTFYIGKHTEIKRNVGGVC